MSSAEHGLGDNCVNSSSSNSEGGSEGSGESHSTRAGGNGNDTDEEYTHDNPQNTNLSHQDSFTSCSNTSIIGKVKTRVSSILPNSISRWFSPSSGNQNENSSPFNGRFSLNSSTSVSRRRRHCEIDYDDEDECNDNEDGDNVHDSNDGGEDELYHDNEEENEDGGVEDKKRIARGLDAHLSHTAGDNENGEENACYDDNCATIAHYSQSQLNRNGQQHFTQIQKINKFHRQQRARDTDLMRTFTHYIPSECENLDNHQSTTRVPNKNRHGSIKQQQPSAKKLRLNSSCYPSMPNDSSIYSRQPLGASTPSVLAGEEHLRRSTTVLHKGPSDQRLPYLTGRRCFPKHLDVRDQQRNNRVEIACNFTLQAKGNEQQQHFSIGENIQQHNSGINRSKSSDAKPTPVTAAGGSKLFSVASTLSCSSNEINPANLREQTTPQFNGRLMNNNSQQNTNEDDGAIGRIRSLRDVLLADTASDSGESSLKDHHHRDHADTDDTKRKGGLFNMSYSSESNNAKMNTTNSRYVQQTFTCGNGLNFYSHLEGRKSLFNAHNGGINNGLGGNGGNSLICAGSTSTTGGFRASTMAGMEKSLNASTVSLNSLNRRQFNASIYGSTSALSDSRLLNAATSSPFYNGLTTYGGAAAYNRFRNTAAANSIRITPTMIRPSVHSSNLSTSAASVGIKVGYGSGVGSTFSNFPCDNSTISNTAKRILELINEYNSPLSDAKKMMAGLRANPPLARGRLTDNDINSARAARLSQVRTPYSRPTTALLLQAKNNTNTHRSDNGRGGGQLPPVKELQVPSMSQLIQMKKIHKTTEKSRQITTENTRYAIMAPSKQQKQPLSSSSSNNSSSINSITSSTVSGTENSSSTATSSNIGIAVSSPLNKPSSYSMPMTSHTGQHYTGKVKNPKMCSTMRGGSLRRGIEDEGTLPELKLPYVVFPRMKSVPTFDIKILPISSYSSTTLTTATSVSADLNHNSTLSHVSSDKNKQLKGDNMNFTFSKPLNLPDNLVLMIMRNELERNVIYNHTATKNYTFRPPREIRESVNTPLKRPFPSDQAPLSTNQFSTQFKKSTNEWECNVCMLINKADKLHCAACETPRSIDFPTKVNVDETIARSIVSYEGFGQKYNKSKGEWQCEFCKIRNQGDVRKCVACGDASAMIVSSASSSILALNNLPIKSSFGDGFKMQMAAIWECKSCWVINQMENNQCVACQTPKDSTTSSSTNLPGFNNNMMGKPLTSLNAPVATTSFKFGFSASTSSALMPSLSLTNTSNKDNKQFKRSTGDNDSDDKFKKIAQQQLTKWECDACLTRNDMDRKKCVCCEQPRADNNLGGKTEENSVSLTSSPTNTSGKQSAAPGADGIVGTSKFNFGATAASKLSCGFGVGNAALSAVDSANIASHTTIPFDTTDTTSGSNTKASSTVVLSLGGCNSVKPDNEDDKITSAHDNEIFPSTASFTLPETTITSGEVGSISKASSSFTQNFKFDPPTTATIASSSAAKGFSLARQTFNLPTNAINNTHPGTSSSSSGALPTPSLTTAIASASNKPLKLPTTTTISQFTFGQNLANTNSQGCSTTALTTTTTTLSFTFGQSLANNSNKGSRTVLTNSQEVTSATSAPSGCLFGGFVFNSSKETNKSGANKATPITISTAASSSSALETATTSVSGFRFNVPSSKMNSGHDGGTSNVATTIGAAVAPITSSSPSLFTFGGIGAQKIQNSSPISLSSTILGANTVPTTTKQQNSFEGFKLGGSVLFNPTGGNLFAGITSSVNSSGLGTGAIVNDSNNIISSSNSSGATAATTSTLTSTTSIGNDNKIMSIFGGNITSNSNTSSASSSLSIFGTENSLKTTNPLLLFGGQNNNMNQSLVTKSNKMKTATDILTTTNTMTSTTITICNANSVSSTFTFGIPDANNKILSTPIIPALISTTSDSAANSIGGGNSGQSIWAKSSNSTFGNLPTFGSMAVTCSTLSSTTSNYFNAITATPSSTIKAATTLSSSPSLFGVSSSTIPGVKVAPVIAFGSGSLQQTSVVNNSGNGNIGSAENLFASNAPTKGNLFGSSSMPANTTVVGGNIVADQSSAFAAPHSTQNTPSMFGLGQQQTTPIFSFGSTAATGGIVGITAGVDKPGAIISLNKPFTFGAPVAQSGGFNFGVAVANSSAAKPSFNFGGMAAASATGATTACSTGVPASVPGATFNFTANQGDSRNASPRPFQFGSAPSGPVFNFTGSSVETTPNTPFQFNASPGMISSNLFAPPPMAPGSQSSSQQARRKVRIPVRRLTPR